MEKPNPPNGWNVIDFLYKGASAAHYEDDDSVFTLEKIAGKNPQCPDLVFLEVRGGIDTATAERLKTRPVENCFNVYRRVDGNVEAIDPLIPTAQRGIEYCIMVADKYMDAQLDDIPGAREKFYETMKEIIRLAKERGTEIRDIRTGERLI